MCPRIMWLKLTLRKGLKPVRKSEVTGRNFWEKENDQDFYFSLFHSSWLAFHVVWLYCCQRYSELLLLYVELSFGIMWWPPTQNVLLQSKSLQRIGLSREATLFCILLGSGHFNQMTVFYPKYLDRNNSFFIW